MKNLNVGLFHTDMGKELGKKGTESDIRMFNRKTDECIFTFMEPVDGKLLPKSQIMSSIDAAVISLADITPESGETVLMLDSMDISRGIIISNNNEDQIKPLIAGTSLESFAMENDPSAIIEILSKLDVERDTESPPVSVIDHAFSVKGVGEVALGLVKRGTVRKHDKLSLLPLGKEITIRSIQMHDNDVDESPAGARVGLCVKGATSEEMKRGSIVCAPGTYMTGTKFRLSFEKNRFYPEVKEGNFHITVGMQSVPVKLSETGETVTIEAERKIAYSKDETFLLLDINAKKLRIMGKGKPL